MTTTIAPRVVMVPFGTLTILIVYDKEAAQNEDYLTSIGAMSKMNAIRLHPEILVSLLCRVVMAWDVVEEDGVTMCPIDAGHMTVLPLPFRAKVATVIMRDSLSRNDARLPTIQKVYECQ